MAQRSLNTGTYKTLTFDPMNWGPERRFIISEIFRGAHVALPDRRTSDRLGWDGIGVVPSFSANETPAMRLEQAQRACVGTLYQLGFELDADLDPSPKHYQYINREELVRIGGQGLTFIDFEFGGMNLRTSASEVRVSMLQRGDMGVKLLEPASVLYLLTQWIAYVQSLQLWRGRRGRKWAKEPRQRVPTMFVECAGAMYSPDGNGVFNDVPRWDVYPPVGDKPGLIFLNWNWDIRSRPLQGVALGFETKP